MYKDPNNYLHFPAWEKHTVNSNFHTLAEAHSEPCQISKTEHIEKIVHGNTPFTNFPKCSTSYIWQGCKYVFVSFNGLRGCLFVFLKNSSFTNLLSQKIDRKIDTVNEYNLANFICFWLMCYYSIALSKCFISL